MPKKLLKDIQTACILQGLFLWTGNEGASKKATIAWDYMSNPKICGWWTSKSLLFGIMLQLLSIFGIYPKNKIDYGLSGCTLINIKQADPTLFDIPKGRSHGLCRRF